MIKVYKIVILFGIGLVLAGCRHLPTLKDNNCEPFNTRGTGNLYFSDDTLTYWFTCFNPNNKYEFLTYREDGTNRKLVKYHIDGRTYDTMYTTQPYGMDWSVKDQIIYYDQGNIFIMNSDCSNKRQLTHDQPYSLSGSFDRSGDHILYFNWNQATDKNIIKYIDLNGNVIYNNMQVEWRHELVGWGFSDLNRFWFMRYKDSTRLAQIGYFNFPDLVNATVIYELSVDKSNNPLTGFCPLPNGRGCLYTLYQSGIYYIDEYDKTPKQIRSNCPNRSYNTLSISGDGSIVLAGCDHWYLRHVGNDRVLITRKEIHALNIDGSGEMTVTK